MATKREMTPRARQWRVDTKLQYQHLAELQGLFPDETTTLEWFETIRWPFGRSCAHCRSYRTKDVPNADPMPYWCSTCRSYFSVRTGTVMQNSKLPFRAWAYAFYEMHTNPNVVTALQLQQDLCISQPAALFLIRRIGAAMAEDDPVFSCLSRQANLV